MKIFLAFFSENIYFSYLCTQILKDIKMKQTKNTSFFVRWQCQADLPAVSPKNNIRNMRVRNVIASIC